MTSLRTERLVLRPIAPKDLDEEHAMLSDPRVMRYITNGDPRSRARVASSIERSQRLFRARGIGLFNVRTITGDFVGDGLLVPIRPSGVGEDEHQASAHADAPIEVGYRLAHEQWAHGYATEIARALVAYAQDDEAGPRLDRLIGVTHPENGASRRVLEKAGLAYVGETDAYYDQVVALYERVRA
jgi:RimJ/RimL family protein N-acetyltransferase